MAGKKKAVKANSPFWHPEKIGDTVQGKFVEFQRTQVGGAIKLDSALIGLSTVLKGLFKPIHTTIKPGDKVKITYTGDTKGQKGRPAWLFDAWVNGKQLVGQFGKATPQEVEDMFKVKEKGA